MALKSAVMLGMLLAATLARVAIGEQGSLSDPASDPARIQYASTKTSSQADNPGPSAAVETTTGRPTDTKNADGNPSNAPEPHITIASPVQTRSDWPIQERISWIAYMGLALVGYAGIVLAISTLRKIERHANDLETAVGAAADTAQATLQYAQAMIRSERPWIMITVEPSPGTENSSTVVATNRGKSPAGIISTAHRIISAIDEANLPPAPEYLIEESCVFPVPIVLLPGESTAIKVFSREDVTQFCVTAEKLRLVEDWNEKIYVYGKVTYNDFIAPEGRNSHETSWCCWYVYGQRKSGLVTIGAPAFTVKT